jgi:signal transduction histidine kinase
MNIFSLSKNLSLTFFAYLLYLIINKESKKPLFKKVLIGLLSAVFFALILTWLSLYIPEPLTTVITIFALSVLFVKINRSNFAYNIFYLTISYAVSYVLYIISSFISSAIFVILLKTHDASIWIVLLIFIIEIFLIFIIKKRSFKLTISYNKNITSAGMTLSGIVFILYGIFRDNQMSAVNLLLPLSGIILCALGLYWWLKKEITTANQELKALKMEAEIKKLNEIHLCLEKTLHNENKKLPAYQEAVEYLIESTENSAIKEKAVLLLGEIKTVIAESSKETSHELREKKFLPPTGKELIDAIFKHYNSICLKEEIDFDLAIRGNVHGILKFITQSDFETLIANLLDNAIIACECSSNSHKSIFVNLSDNRLSVMDSGISFPQEVLESLGKQRITTRADSGGSGLGFLTIFEIARVCKASVVITENTSFKTVAVWFDGKGEYRVDSQGSRLKLAKYLKCEKPRL